MRSSVQILPRIRLDLYADDQAREVDRPIALGVTQVRWDKRPDGSDYVTLADPEGSRFCVIDPASSPGMAGLRLRPAPVVNVSCASDIMRDPLQPLRGGEERVRELGTGI